MEITLVFIILTAAIILFATEWIRMDLVSLMVLLALNLSGLVTTEEAFSGFSNPAVITVAAMFVISAAITNTGAMGKLSERLIRLANGKESRLVGAVMTSVAAFSSVVNNIGATAVLLPVVSSICRKLSISPSRLLMPLAFGSLLGGICTLVGTPPNILMNSLLLQYGGESFGMFDFTPVGLPITACGILYMVMVGRRLLPTRKSNLLTESYQVKEYVTEVEILDKSPLAGLTIAAAGLEHDFNLRVRAVMRNGRKHPQPRPNNKLKAGDILFLEGNPAGILKMRQTKGLRIVPERDNPPPEGLAKELVVVEASLAPTSDLAGKTLAEVKFRETHGLNVLALWRRGAPVVKKVEHVALMFGDVLLLQGSEERVFHLGKEHGFLLLGGVPPISYRPDKGLPALLILAATILLAASGLLPIMAAATLGALAMVLCRCLTVQDAYESIDWRIIVLIAGTLPLGLAMQNSGAAKVLADLLLDFVGPWGPWATLAGITLFTSLLTEVMSHSAAAVLMAPIAFNSAVTLGVDPKPFFLAVAVAASSCFMTPISHQSNALVMGPGGYRFFDYMRVGAPLNLLIWILATLIIPLFFPFSV